MPVHKQDIIQSIRRNSSQSVPRPEFKKELWKDLEKKMPRKTFFGVVFKQATPLQIRFLGMIVIVILGVSYFKNEALFHIGPMVDDWQYGTTVQTEVGITQFARPSANDAGFRMNSPFSGFSGSQGHSAPKAIAPSTGGSAQTYNLSPSLRESAMSDTGFAVGGSKDINNFRENIKNGYLPLPTDITVEGLYYEYYFDTTNNSLQCSELFCPTYSTASSAHPLTKSNESYISVGLMGGDKANQVTRPNLNLVVVLDISGSMSSQFNQYYYDQNTQQRVEVSDQESKMRIATDSINAMLGNLKPGDQISVVLFDDKAYLAKPLTIVKNTDMNALKKHISELTPQGGTNLESGIKEAMTVLGETTSNAQTETRMVVLTDAMPNTGSTDREGFVSLTRQNADKGIHTTFIGIGVDFNTDLIESLTKIQGANYYSVHSSSEFRKRVDEEFEYMVTPLVYDLQLSVDSEDWEIEKVYGSPEANQATGEIMKVNTLFPSASTEEGVKGGVVLLKMKPKKEFTESINKPFWDFSQDKQTVKLLVKYKDRSGKEFSNFQTVPLSQSAQNQFDNNGTRKAVVLAQYAELLQSWTTYDRNYVATPSIFPMEETWNYGSDSTILKEKTFGSQPSQWERGSNALKLSPMYRTQFEQFRAYLINEKQIIGDSDMQKEIDLIDQILKTNQSHLIID